MKLTSTLRLFLLLTIVWIAQTQWASGAVFSFSRTEYSVGEGMVTAVITVTVDRSEDRDPGQTYTVDYKTLRGFCRE